jgi:hydrophobe/amphiphile efflux-3 (HAE3) family protein
MWLRLARLIVRRPVRVLVVALMMTAVLATGLGALEFQTDQATMVDPSTRVFEDNVRYQDRFGGETMLVLFTGEPVGLFEPASITELQRLEDELRAVPGVSSVIGPYTSVAYAADQLAVAPALISGAAARADDAPAYQAQTSAEIARLEAAGAQTLTNPDFVRFLVFRSDGEIREAQKTTFPDPEHALLVAQLDGNASIDEQGASAEAIKDVVGRHSFPGQEVLVTGTPVLLDEINGYLQGGMTTLGLIATGVMVVVLWLAFRVRLRLLPLAVMALGSIAALGAAVLGGVQLSLVTIAGLPIFVGLGVDFAIQMHNRYVEQRSIGGTPADSAIVAVTRMGSPLTLAMVAAAFGFVALRFSPVPMIRDFGWLLCIGVIVLVAMALVLPAALLVLADRRKDDRVTDRGPGLVERVVARMVTLPTAVVVAVLVGGGVVAAAGFVVEGRMPIDTEVENWVDQDGDAVTELRALRAATGYSTLLGVLIEADDVTTDEVVAWMYRFQTAELERHRGDLIQAASMPGIAADVVSITPTGADVIALHDIAPPDVQRSTLTDDRTMANLQFAIGDLSLGERDELLEQIEADLAGDLAPPPGVTVTPSGLAVIGIELVKGMEANRRVLTLVALGFVSAWLLLVSRLRPLGLLRIVPVILAVGSATFATWALGFELTPLTTVAAPLVIAVATEFTVLLQARYEEERAHGATPDEATEALPRIGRAFVASGLTLVGGFAVMAASPMVLLRDFGIVVAIDVVIALVCALTVMPPLLRWTDRRGGAPDLVIDLVTVTVAASTTLDEDERRIVR